MYLPAPHDTPEDTPSDHVAPGGVAATERPRLSDEAWRTLVLRYGGALRYTLQRRVSLVSDADDLVQQALLQAVAGWSAFRGEAEVSTWVFGIAHNLARQHVSRGTAGPVQFGRDDAVDEAPCTVPGPCEQLMQREALARLQSGLDELPASQTAALWLIAVDGLSYGEAAALLGVSVAAVKHRVARARTTLRAGGV
ncbi:sigma-70 family RNA polymerase sigma factor [Hydrogenophaga sp.]|uniref:RNA polymerase sigma factor n=1 Tax=Hydrogenophaga sp. TaxID=1904254 RepID=UPI0025C3645A|nr:sigma-70 family RNA polymerase sigma factor [Hydrogenophaga sp.]MBT9462675.1 sigma-70 family RNA polymerase sigma factor [Hydrogenophaga sp.]